MLCDTDFNAVSLLYGAFTLPDTETDTETNKKWVV